MIAATAAGRHKVAYAGDNNVSRGRLNAEFAKILRSKEVSDRLLGDGVVPAPGTPDEFGAFIAREIDVVRGIVARAGIKLD